MWKGPGITTLQVKFLTVTKGNKYLQKGAKLTFNIRGNCLKMFYNYLKSLKSFKLNPFTNSQLSSDVGFGERRCPVGQDRRVPFLDQKGEATPEEGCGLRLILTRVN